MKNNDLILQKLSKSYHGQVVFSDLSLALSPGNAYCLMAPSGTGKTTLFRILMGLETPDSGTIDGLKNLKISAVFQEDRLLEGYDVLTNLRFVCRQRLPTQNFLPTLQPFCRKMPCPSRYANFPAA